MAFQRELRGEVEVACAPIASTTAVTGPKEANETDEDSCKVRFDGFPPGVDLSSDEIVKKILQAIGLARFEMHIARVREWINRNPRSTDQSSSRQIVAQLSSPFIRDEVIGASPALRDLTMSQIFGVEAEGRIRASPVLPRGVYHLRRRALDLARSKRGKEGGGIGLYVREDLAVEKLVATESIYNYTPEYQIISIKNSNNVKLIFATIYRSPEAGYSEEFFEVFYRLLPLYDNVIVTMGFNIHVNRPNVQHVGRLIKQLEQLSLHLVSTVPTHHVIYHDGSIHENCLDLFIVRDTSLIESFSRSSSPFTVAHDFIDFDYRLSYDIAPAVTKFTRDFRRVTTETFAPFVEREITVGFSRDGLSLFVVDEAAVGGRVVTGALLDLAVATLSSALIAAADLAAPLSAPRPASRRKPWVTSQIRDLIRERDLAYRLFWRGRSSFAAHKELRSRARNLLDAAKNQLPPHASRGPWTGSPDGARCVAWEFRLPDYRYHWHRSLPMSSALTMLL
ncbi:unnamed protein product [Trichogramma brassicae]|uniref:Endonuclease/exonuclease/phosphatase domain-containing protein n=1 Tax=Trichogramma brassicae TaxID=86971 RepID=A0A6H5J006_9HYME|nr:unnamed protein product [Trichogramma brassicae]